MKKLFFYAILGTAFTLLSSFTEITTNVPAGAGNSTGKSAFYCFFAQTECVVFGVRIWEAEYPSWEACRKA